MNHQSNHEGLFCKENLIMLIVSTLLAFLVGKLLDPLFTLLYSLFINTGGTVVKHISNSTYKQISNGFSEQPSMLSFYLLCVLTWAFLSHAFNKLRDSYNQLLDEYKKYKSILEMVDMPVLDASKQEGITMSNSSKDNNADSGVLAKKINSRVHKIKFEYYTLLIFFIFLYVFLIFTYSRSLYINTKITSITNNIEIVSPYISDTEYKQLKSTFHTMDSSEDYNDLTSTLSDIAKEYSLILKK